MSIYENLSIFINIEHTISKCEFSQYFPKPPLESSPSRTMEAKRQACNNNIEIDGTYSRRFITNGGLFGETNYECMLVLSGGLYTCSGTCSPGLHSSSLFFHCFASSAMVYCQFMNELSIKIKKNGELMNAYDYNFKH